MSRIGRKPIVIPAGVEVKVDEADHAITVKGPKGTLHSKFHPLMTVKVEGNEILVTRPNDEKEARSLHGLTRTNIHNMVVGVTEGFRKDLEIQGVGYRCAKQGSKLVLTLGFSHPVEVANRDHQDRSQGCSAFQHPGQRQAGSRPVCGRSPQQAPA